MPKRARRVFLRSGSNNYQWKIKAPQELQHLYPKGWAHRCSLGTSDLQQANLLASKLEAEWQGRFATELARLNPTKVEAITPAMAQFFAEQVRHGALSDDAQLRTTPEDQAWLLHWMREMGMDGADVAPAQFGGMPNALADMLEGLHHKHHTDAKRAFARGQIDKAIPALQRVAAQAGIAFDESTPGYKEALQEVSKAIRQTTEAVVQRDQGDIVDTPAPSDLKAIEAAKKPRRLRTVFERWKASADRKPDSIRAMERALVAFETQSGNPVLANITRDMGDAFKAWLLQQNLAPKTQHDRMTAVKSLLNYAARDLEWIGKNPWAGLDIKHDPKGKRDPWTPEQVKAFLTLPLFTRYELPTQERAGKDAAYWIPLLGLYTGARVGELCQLRVADVIMRDGAPFLSINEEGERSTVKTVAGVRDIPVHSELVRLGFLEYAADVRKRGEEQLWPALKLGEDKPGRPFSNWFGTYRKKSSVGVPDFHSIRHTVRSKMNRAKIPVATQDRITGHETNGSVGVTVYTHIAEDELQEAVEAIQYPGLTLPRVYAASE